MGAAGMVVAEMGAWRELPDSMANRAASPEPPHLGRNYRVRSVEIDSVLDQWRGRMRRAFVIPLAASALLIAAAPALSQSPLPPPPGGPAPQQSRPLAPPPGPSVQPLRGPQQPPQTAPQQAAPQQAAPKPYQPVAVNPPLPVKEPSLDAFRSQLGDIVNRKDRAALAKLVVAKDFFWLGEKGDRADKKRAGIDNLARALALNEKDGMGWEALAGYAAEPTGMALPDKKDVICAPADP